MKNWLKEHEIPGIFVLVIPIGLAILLSIISVCKVPFSATTPYYYSAAKELISGGRIQSSIWPVGYTGFLVMCVHLGGLQGVFWGQSILYISSVIVAFIFFRALSSSQIVALLGSCILALHPYLFVNIKRIVDNNLAVILFLTFCTVTFYINANRNRYGLIAFLGFLLGLLMAVRPNSFSLLLAPIVLFAIGGHFRTSRIVLKILIFLIAVFITLGSVGTVARGSFFFLPRNGAYNFFAGANKYTADCLLSRYNAENSIGKALESEGISPGAKDIEATYWRLGLKYVFQHPVQYLWLCELKFITLFRPDYREIAATTTINSFYIKVIAQTLMAAPFFLWLLTLVLTGINRIPSRSWPVLPIVALYILPFLATNADPRFRLPVDVVILLDTVYRFSLMHHRILTNKLSGFKVPT